MRIGLQTWGSEGDIQPFTALAAGLVKAGHTVTLVVSSTIGQTYDDHASRFGYRLVCSGNLPKATPEQAEWAWRHMIRIRNPLKQLDLVTKYTFDPLVERMYAAATELCAENDAVVGYFFAFPLRVAALKAGVPFATLNVVRHCLPSAQIPPPGILSLGPWSYGIGWRMLRKRINRIMLPRVNALLAREGLPQDSDVLSQSWAADKLNLIAVSPQICQTPPDWEARHQVCGFLNSPASGMMDPFPAGLEDFLSAGSPPVYVTFGSMMIESPAFLDEVAELWTKAIRRVGCRAILQLPWGKFPELRADPNFFVVKRAPYKQIFPRCAMVVHHGGAGTTQSALLAGKPSLVVAHLCDQFFTELERVGVAGPTLMRKGLNPKQLAAGITRVLARPDLTQRAIELGAKMSEENGVATAVQLLEKHFS